ncbi:N-6 DNA methylase [Mucilaginibacter sp. ZT4R22]|uniref:site-specific DNA-methyltransferase (adenine-specific) n=1 Tax=Mucilaginibacter pankratovii TaxID=2772110 RepID=A0ABR7WYQ8_9SPHI|nr:N-6 DNA methylase [Mucilaginibacter pankratovii]MBD1367423.1 N-6 DNA methylase [Mucilaginibacter pankratovii]
MTLHEAIQELLTTSDQALTSSEVAEKINSSQSYKRKDGQQLTPTQITARVNQYANVFTVTSDGLITLIDKDILRFKNAYYHILNRFRDGKYGFFEYKPLALIALFVGWRDRFPYRFLDYPSQEVIDELITSNLEFLAPITRDELISLIIRLEEKDRHWLWGVLQDIKSFPKPSAVDFRDFFNDIINEFTNADSFHNGQYSSPQVLSKFIGSLFFIPNNGLIIDPFAGTASSLLQAYQYNFENSPQLIANDISLTASILGSLNIFVNGYQEVDYQISDFFAKPFPDKFADLVVTVPPLGIRQKQYIYELKGVSPVLLDDFIWNSFDGMIDATAAAILSTVSLLKEGGKAVIVVPDGVLFSVKRDFLFLRQILVHANLLKGVISLPSGMFRPYFSVSTSVLIIEKTLPRKNGIFLFDSSKLTVEAFEARSFEIKSAYHNQDRIENSIYIDPDEIPFKNYDLSPKRYLLEMPSGGNHLPLHELCEIIYTGTGVNKSNINKNHGIPFIQLGDLIDSTGLNEIDNSKTEYFISDEELLAKSPRYIPDKAVLVAKVGSKLKSSLYRYSGPALCNPNIIVVKTNESQLLPEYLITQLQSEYVINQIEAIRHNIGVPHYSKTDFINIQINALPIEEQRNFIASFYGKKLQEVKKIVDLQREDDLYNIIASLKHELKQPISSLGMDVTTLDEFLQDKIASGNSLSWEDYVVPLLPGQNPSDETHLLFKNVMHRMLSSIKDAQETLTKAEEILNIGGGVFAPEKIPLKHFLNQVIKPVFANNNCTITIVGDEREIMADKYQIEVLFKRLIENAIKHGFQGRTNKADNLINIRISSKTANKDYNEIIVENNGKTFPAEFDIAKFQMVGQTSNRRSGTGFGGFHIKRVIESHQGELHLADKKEISESQFKVRFKIYLP